MQLRRLARGARYLLSDPRWDPDLAAGRLALLDSESGLQICWSELEGKPPLLLSPGFGSRLHDYGALRQAFLDRYCLYRMVHPGTDRSAAARIGAAHLLHMGLLGWSRQFSARKLRRYIHSPTHRQTRSRQLSQAIDFVLKHSRQSSLSLAGHSFGTDTVLSYAVSQAETSIIKDLYLFSPHPAGYLIPEQSLKRRLARKVLVITGDADYTADGVGPNERWGVLKPLADGNKVQGVFLWQFGHLDPALSCPRQAWVNQLGTELFSRT